MTARPEGSRVTRSHACLLTLIAVAPVAARAQTSIYDGRLTCGPTEHGTVPPGTDAITILSRNYQGTYTHLMDSTGIAGLRDFGRGDLVGRDLTLKGGGNAGGVVVRSAIKASNTGRTYRLRGTQIFSGKGFPAPVTRTCKGTAILVIG